MVLIDEIVEMFKLFETWNVSQQKEKEKSVGERSRGKSPFLLPISNLYRFFDYCVEKKLKIGEI